MTRDQLRLKEFSDRLVKATLGTSVWDNETSFAFSRSDARELVDAIDAVLATPSESPEAPWKPDDELEDQPSIVMV